MFGLATFLYILFCPQLIKSYENDVDFVLHQSHIWTNYKKNLIISYLSSRNVEPLSDSMNTKDVMFIYYDYEDTSKLVLRIITWGFYVLSICLMSVPTIWHFLYYGIINPVILPT